MLTYVLASFITGCPSSNPALPVKAFPALTVSTTSYKAGDTISVSFDNSMASGKDMYMALYSGLAIMYAPITGSGSSMTVKLPRGLMGTVYGVVTTNGTAVNDANTVAGPAILMFPFDSSVRQMS